VEFDILTSILQGLLLSLILYLFYNADLLEIARFTKLVISYINNISFFVKGITIKLIVRKLEVLHAKANK
jgi:hypothetical protein